MEIKVTKTTSPKEKPKKGEKLGFGKIFTDHMFIMNYTEGKGYTVDGQRIAVGRELNLRIAGFSEVGVCDTINVQSES